jgi:hypothetical protein
MHVRFKGGATRSFTLPRPLPAHERSGDSRDRPPAR